MRVDGAYRKLRETALTLTSKQVGAIGDGSPDAPYGVVMDLAPERGVATLTSFASGDASLYYSTGGGLLGGIGQPKVNLAAKAFVRAASAFVAQAGAAPDHGLPPKGKVFFYLLTPTGLRRAEGEYEELMSATGHLVPLFAAAQEVITQFRLIQEAQERRK